MKSEKRSTKKKDQKQKQHINENIISGNILSIGELDLIFEINFTDVELEIPNSQNEEKKYYKLENIYTLHDLKFISSLSNEFINKIKLKPNNHLIRQLLLGNKISKKKNMIELICYNLPLFEEPDEKYFKKIFDQVCLNHKLTINKKPLHHEGRYSLILQLRHKNEYKEIIIGKTPIMFREKKFKKAKEKRDLDEVEENDKEEMEQNEREEKKQEKLEYYKEERDRIKRELIIEKTKENFYLDDSNNKSNISIINNKSLSINNKSTNKSRSLIKKIKQKNKNNEEIKNDEDESEEEIQEDEDYDINEAMKEKKIPKFRRKNTVLCNLAPMGNKYDLIYLNFNLIKIIPGNFNMKDFIELLIFFKKKKILIFINFFKEELEEDELEEEQKIFETLYLRDEKKREKEKKYLEERHKKEEEINEMKKEIEKLKERKNDIIENTKEEVLNMTEKRKEEEIKKVEFELENLEMNLIEKEDDLRADIELDNEFKKREEQNKKNEDKKLKKQEKKQIKLINDIYYLTDAFFFDTKQACDIFTHHYLYYTKDTDKTKRINRQKLYDYFVTEISRGHRPPIEGNKVAFFMDDFSKYLIIYTSKKSSSKQELNPQPYPKINTHNLDLVNRYKDILTQFKNDFYDIYISLPAHEIAANHGIISPEIIYPTFLAGLDIIKRQVELKKCGINYIEEDSIYKVKISEKSLKQELEKLSINGKEGNFVLDCTNKTKSSLKDYISLYDYNLKDFFSSDKIRKNLQNKGFINDKGYIMYDPLHRNIMGAKFQNKKQYKEEELKNKIISNIKNIDVPARLKDKEYDPKKDAEKQAIPTNRKIPFIKTKKKKKRGGEKSNSEGNASSSEGEGKKY